MSFSSDYEVEPGVIWCSDACFDGFGAQDDVESADSDRMSERIEDIKKSSAGGYWVLWATRKTPG